MSHALFEQAAEGRHHALSAGTTPADHVHPEVVESAEGIWNLKGYVNNSWHRVHFTVARG